MGSILFILCISILSQAQTPKKTPDAISLFGSKPVQLSVGKDGITRKEGGAICDLTAIGTGTHYSEWGETEKDARIIVKKKCSNDSGLLLCKEDKITCKADKP